MLTVFAALTLCVDLIVSIPLWNLDGDTQSFHSINQLLILGFAIGQGAFWLIVWSRRRADAKLWLPVALVSLLFGMFVLSKVSELNTELTVVLLLGSCGASVLPKLLDRAASPYSSPWGKSAIVLGGVIAFGMICFGTIYLLLPRRAVLIEHEIVLFGGFLSLFSGVVFSSSRYRRSSLHSIVLGSTFVLSLMCVYRLTPAQHHFIFLFFFATQSLYLWIAGNLLMTADRLDAPEGEWIETHHLDEDLWPQPPTSE